MTRLPSTKQLQHLVRLAEVRHFGKAADSLGITQPTLSASIKELESVLGGALIDRAGKTTRLTPLGEDIARRAEKVVSELCDLVESAGAQAAPLTGVLRLGVIPTISAFLLPRLLPALRQRYPQLKVYLIEDQTQRLLEIMGRGELDVILLALPCECEGESFILARDAFIAAVRRDNPLAKKKSLSAKDLRGEKFLTLQDGHCLRDQALSACGLKTSSDERHAATSLHTLVQMVDNGLGITLVPQMAVKAGLLEGTGLVTRPLETTAAYRDIALLWRKGAARSEELRLLGAELKKLFNR